MNNSTDRLYAALRRHAERECPRTRDSYLIGLLLGILDGQADPERLGELAAWYERKESSV